MLRIQKVDAVHPHPFTALGWQVRGIRRMITGVATTRKPPSIPSPIMKEQQ